MSRSVICVAVVLTAAWFVSALLMSTRGLDITDESYYLLTYRDWDTNLRTFTGSQYVYGPIFDLVGQSVPGLRLVRLVTVLAAHAALAWAFVTWLQGQLPDKGLTRAGRWAAGLTILGSGGVIYGWLPLSPGYNDVSVLGTLGLAAAVLRIAAGCRDSRRIPLLPVVVVAPVVVAILLAKSVAGLPSVLFLAAVVSALVAKARARGVIRASVALMGSLVVTLGLVNGLVMPFDRMLPPIRAVNALVGAGTNSPLRLFELYTSSTAHLLGQAGRVLVIPAVLILVGWVLLRARWRRLGTALLVLAAPVGLVLRWPERAGLPPAGANAILDYTTGITAMALLALAVTAVGRLVERTPRPAGRQRSTGSAIIVGTLALLPAVQALGTGNELYVMAVNQAGCWVALMVMAVATVAGKRWLLAPLVSTGLSTLVVAAASGVGGLLEHPYRTDPFLEATTPIRGGGVVSGLKVSAERSAAFDRLLALESEGGESTGRLVMAFDEMPGLVLLLDGRTPGEAWYSATDQARTAAGIRASCQLFRDESAGPPVALFDRQPSASDRAALRDCGVVLKEDPVTVRLVGRADVLLFSTTKALA